MISVFQTNFPPSNSPIVDTSGNMSNVGMSFFRAIWNRTGMGPGLQSTVNAAVTAALGGTALTDDWNYINAGSGSVTLPALTGGQAVVVFNTSVAPNLTVTAPAGATIDGGGSYPIPITKMQIFWFISATIISSTQLG